MIRTALLLITSFFFFLKLIVFFACSLKDSQNFFIHKTTSAYTMLIFYALNDDIVDIEKPDGICLPTFVVEEFSG